MLNIGNKKSNQYYLHFSELANLRPDAHPDERTQFIRNKYIKKQFAEFINNDTPSKIYQEKLDKGKYTTFKLGSIQYRIVDDEVGKDSQEVKSGSFLNKFLKKSQELNKAENLIDFIDTTDTNSDHANADEKPDSDKGSSHQIKSDTDLINFDFFFSDKQRKAKAPETASIQP